MALERLNKCPLCKSGLFLNLTTVKDHSISRENFVVCKCSNCGFKFTNPRPDSDSIGQYYKSEDYISHRNKSTNPINFLYKLVRKFTIQQKIALLKKYLPQNPQLLDYGCGTGFLLNAAQKKGWSAQGIEPDRGARKLAQAKNLEIYPELEKLNKNSQFDGITLFHVLEHVHELRKTFKRLKKILKPDGILFIALPNNDSLDALEYREKWAAYDVPRHLYHFDQQSVSVLAETFKMEVIDTIPMKFDSYYVSMLSEKYASADIGQIKQMFFGIKMGLKSNRWATSNNNNYSSLLYILKKK